MMATINRIIIIIILLFIFYYYYHHYNTTITSVTIVIIIIIIIIDLNVLPEYYHIRIDVFHSTRLVLSLDFDGPV